ncbi:hypothetical protein Q7P37_007627 [Cladosporium fusiforme]
MPPALQHMAHALQTNPQLYDNHPPLSYAHAPLRSYQYSLASAAALPPTDAMKQQPAPPAPTAPQNVDIPFDDHVNEDVSFGTRQRAIKAIKAIKAVIDIDESIIEGGSSTLCSKTCKHFPHSRAGRVIDSIFDGMKPVELFTLKRDGKMIQQLRVLEESAEKYSLDVALD